MMNKADRQQFLITNAFNQKIDIKLELGLMKLTGEKEFSSAK